MSSLLRELHQAGHPHAAYADDLIIIIRGNSRREVERSAQTMVDLVSRWAETHRLQISNTKTNLAPLKGTFHDRHPIVSLQGAHLRMMHTFQYLGVTFGAGFSCIRTCKP